ncbi:MAG: hypothetical protein PF904_01165 [Kiritimatiellae bacterium]|jgi:hypothetical protein|nr:hypothetical protein [Kiritimatiellia bacterium]
MKSFMSINIMRALPHSRERHTLQDILPQLDIGIGIDIGIENTVQISIPNDGFTLRAHAEITSHFSGYCITPDFVAET